MIRFVFPLSISKPGQTYKIRITPPEAGPVRIKSAVGTRPDNRRDPLPGDKRQTALAQGA
jgi:hypothetical protein